MKIRNGGGLNPDDFITRWKNSGSSERANFQQFAIELTQLLGVQAPKPATSDAQNDDYRFERPVTFIHTSTQSRGYIDLYRRGAFVMEAKQGTRGRDEDETQLALLPELPPKQRHGHGVRGSRRWDDTMLRARNQADGYARAVAREDGWPPFLMVVDVGHVIEVYADFSGQGQGYTQYPDGNRYRIALDDLRDDKVRARLDGPADTGPGQDQRGSDPRGGRPPAQCFNPFPFPALTMAQTTRLRSLGEQLDAHRKAQQAAHPKLTLTALYNVLEKLRGGERIEGKDREVYEQGLVGILRKLHDDLDAEVAAAYGWPVDLPENDLLQRLVDLNRERAAEEARGLVRWLRPDYQNPAGRSAASQWEQVEADLGVVPVAAKTP